MGIKQRPIPDPQLAHPHEAGATIDVMQPVEHRRLGTIHYVWPKHWAYHYEAAHAAFEELERLHEELVSFPVGPGAIRSIDDIEFIGTIYKAGSQLVSEVVRTLQHLCEEIERWTKTPMGGPTIESRLDTAGAAAGLDGMRDGTGYSAFQQLRAKRDAIEHPKSGNTYNAADTTWDEVPLAWFMSDGVLEAYGAYLDWFNGIADAWESKKADWPEEPAVLDVEIRGLRSLRPFKKPPRTT